MSNLLWIILGLGAVIIVWLVIVYNGLIRAKNRTDEAWSDIDVQLKRRYDLIPNLVETVKGYASHEQGTLQKVVEARNAAMSASGTTAEKAAVENELSQTLKSIFALSEAYPDLKANTTFLKLQDELSDTENKIQAARRFYNGNVRDFNTMIQVFPNNAINGLLNFKQYDFFEASAAEKEAVQVKF